MCCRNNNKLINILADSVNTKKELCKYYDHNIILFIINSDALL